MSGIVGQAITVLFGRGIVRVAQFVLFILLARLLSPAEFGWFGILTTAIALAAMLGSLGLRQSIAYEIGQGRLTPGQATGTALALWPLLTLVSAGVVVLLYANAVPNTTYSQLAIVIVAGVAGTMLVTLIQGVHLGRGNIRSFTASETFPRVSVLAIVLILVMVGALTLTSALWAHVGAFLLALPLTLFLALRGAGSLQLRLKALPRMLPYGLIFAFNLFLITLSARLSMFVIERVQGAADAGQFFAAARVSEIFLEAATAMAMVLFSSAARQSRSKSVIERSARMAAWAFWFFAAIAVVVVFTAPLLLTLILGEGYSDAGPALQLIALGLAPAAASKMIYSTLAGNGQPFFGTPVIAGSFVVNVVLALVLVPAYGITGGAGALVIGQYCLFVGYVVICRARHGIKVRTLLVPTPQDARRVASTVKTKLKRRG